MLAALPDPDLAQRASDVRQVAEAVSIGWPAGAAAPPPDGAFILVRREVDPADLIRLADDGAGRRGLGRRRRQLARGDHRPRARPADAGRRRPGGAHRAGRAPRDPRRHRAGELIVDPAPADLSPRSARPAPASAVTASSAGSAAPRDRAYDRRRRAGHVLCNVASAAETRLGLADGAAGVGLLRTEIPFTGARAGRPATEHLAAARARSSACSRASARSSGCSTSPATRSRRSPAPRPARVARAPPARSPPSSGRSCWPAPAPSSAS